MALLFVFQLCPTNSAQAEQVLSLSCDYQTIEIKNMPDSFDIVAEIDQASSYTGSDVKWYFQNIQITLNIQNGEKSSILTVYKETYNHISAESKLTFIAKIGSSISQSIVIDFVFSEVENVTINSSGSLSQTISHASKVDFTLSFDGYPQSTDFKWFIKSSTNKYSQVGGNKNTFSFLPTQAGDYYIFATVNNIRSNTKVLSVRYEQISSLEITKERLTNNKNGFDIYRFSVTNISQGQKQFYDVENINWYNNLDGTLLQKGGLEFEYSVTGPTTLHVIAEYKNDMTHITSQTQKLEVSINRTREILIALAISFGVIGLFTIIGIVVKIKKERVW